MNERSSTKVSHFILIGWKLTKKSLFLFLIGQLKKSSQKIASRNKTLPGMMYGMFPIKTLHCTLICQVAWLLEVWLVKYKNSSPMKLLGQLEPNIARMIFGKSSTKISQKHGCLRQLLFLIAFLRVVSA